MQTEVGHWELNCMSLFRGNMFIWVLTKSHHKVIISFFFVATANCSSPFLFFSFMELLGQRVCMDLKSYRGLSLFQIASMSATRQWQPLSAQAQVRYCAIDSVYDLVVIVIVFEVVLFMVSDAQPVDDDVQLFCRIRFVVCEVVLLLSLWTKVVSIIVFVAFTSFDLLLSHFPPLIYIRVLANMCCRDLYWYGRQRPLTRFYQISPI